MTAPGLPHVGDSARLAAVAATRLLDTEPEAAFDDLARLAATLLHAPFAFITLVDTQRSFWKSRIGLPLDGPVQNKVEESFCQYVIASGEELIAGDVTLNPLTAHNPSIASMGVRAWAGFPLVSADGQSLGSFCVVDTVVRDWTDADIEVLRVLSGAAGRELALRSAVDQAATANEQLALMVQVGEALTETLDIEEAVGRLARLVVPVLGDWSVVALATDDGTLRDVSWWHAREDLRPVLDRFAGARFVGLDRKGATHDAQRTGQPVVQDFGALEEGLAMLRSEQAREAYLTLNPDGYGVWPLVFGPTVHGVLVVARDRGREAFTAAEIGLAANIAHRAGTVLDNARLYARQHATTRQLARVNDRLRAAGRHDRAVARALQDAMLTRLPEPDHLHLAARYVTADSNDQVGGDWYDALLPPDGATTMMIGDVAGHDIAAASVMGQLRNILRALAWEHDEEPPSALIIRLDRAMADLGIRTLTTLSVARIEQDTAARADGLRTFRLSSAGHPQPVLMTCDGGARFLDVQADPPLAVAAGITRRDFETTVRPGETVLMYTDGLIETRSHNLDERQRELLAVLAKCQDLSLDGLLDTILAEMVGIDPDDDVALLAVRFHPEDRPRPADASARLD